MLPVAPMTSVLPVATVILPPESVNTPLIVSVRLFEMASVRLVPSVKLLTVTSLVEIAASLLTPLAGNVTSAPVGGTVLQFQFKPVCQSEVEAPFQVGAFGVIAAFIFGQGISDGLSGGATSSSAAAADPDTNSK